MSCENACYEATIDTCDDIIIRAGFAADVSLYWLITKVGSANIHQRLTTTNGSGDLIIPKSQLPAGFLIKGGKYKIQVRTGSSYLQPVIFVFGENEYGCILAELQNVYREDDDASEVNVIQFTEFITSNAGLLTKEYNFQIQFDGTEGKGLVDEGIVIPECAINEDYFIEEVWCTVINDMIAPDGTYLTLGIETDDIDAGLDDTTGQVVALNAAVTGLIQPAYTKATASRILVMDVKGGSISAGIINLTVKIRKL